VRILLIKTSSMGDIIHTLPALTDAGRVFPHLRFDWVVEEAFQQIPAWHPQVERVIPVALRRWRKHPFASSTRTEWRQFKQALNETAYDFILDAQGLLKSALLGYFARGTRVGFDFKSAREPLAAFTYQHKFAVNRQQHAITRVRQLFSLALDYPMPDTSPDYGMTQPFLSLNETQPYLVFLHGTTWTSKQWPEIYWNWLMELATASGYHVKIASGDAKEFARAQRIAASHAQAEVLPRLEIAQMAKMLSQAAGVVAVDTGFAHLAAALNVPLVSLYGPTNGKLTGTLGACSQLISADFPCAPCLKRTCIYRGESTVQPACFESLTPEKVWRTLMGVMKHR
jgi:heptosyltransferase I